MPSSMTVFPRERSVEPSEVATIRDSSQDEVGRGLDGLKGEAVA